MQTVVLLVVLALATFGFQLPQQEIQLRKARSVPADGTIIGAVSDLDVLPNGEIIVLDGQAKELMVFSPDGNLVRTLGREGEGPGEIKGAVALRAR